MHLNKHIKSYSSFIFENKTSSESFLENLNKVVLSQINSDKEAIEATTVIKDFIHENMSNLSELMMVPDFVKGFYESLEPWYNKYKEELDSKEIEHFIGNKDRNDPFEKDIPTDTETEEDELGDWEFEM